MLCGKSITLVSLYVLSEKSSNSNTASRPTLCIEIVRQSWERVESTCAVCGTSTVSSTTKAGKTYNASRSRDVAFRKGRPGSTIQVYDLFLIANLFLFLLMWDSSGISGMGLLHDFPIEVLVAYGAKVNGLITAPNHQWWRFVTPMFLHVNLIHLLVNHV